MDIDSERFASAVAERIKHKKYDELFSGGCCFHFALRAFNKGLGSLACTRSSYDQTRIGHVFVATVDGSAFDHKGHRSLVDLKRDFSPWNIPHFPITDAEVMSFISEQELPEELLQRVYAIADEIIEEQA